MFRSAARVRITALIQSSVLAIALLAGWSSASAAPTPPLPPHRFGPPWQVTVQADTQLLAAADPSAGAVEPVSAGTVLPALNEVTGADGAAWTQVPDGYLPSSQAPERLDPWLAVVQPDTLDLLALPTPSSAVLRTVHAGDLVRVTGAAGGVNGNQDVWWATTDGYVHLDTLQMADAAANQMWSMPDASEAPNGWWGSVNGSTNVRAGPSTDDPVVGTFSGGEHVKVLAQVSGDPINADPTWDRIDGGRYAGAYVHESFIDRLPDPQPTVAPEPDGSAPGPWIVVNRAAFTLTLVQDGQPVFTTYVALGEAGVNTPTGHYTTYLKLEADRMTSSRAGHVEHAYDLPNVPFTQYYKDGGYAIHGTYWHDLFGTKQSQGCINLTVTDSAYLFSQTQPPVPAGADQAGDDQNATAVVILD